MRILIYTGKGGVGKTSIAAATAVMLASKGKRVLVMSTDQAHSLGDSLDQTLGADPVKAMENLFALEIDPVIESQKAWGNLRDYLKEIISGKANGGIAADEVLLFPGLDELFSLLRIIDACESGKYDVIIVDCAPTGETLSLLRYPEQLKVICDKLLPSVRNMNRVFGGLISRKTRVPKPRDLVFEEFEKVVNRLEELYQILKDRNRCSLRIVTTPERIVMEEAKRSYTWINEYDFGIDAICINKIYPPEAMQGYFSAWNAMQAESLQMAEESFGECRIFRLLLQNEEIRGLDSLKAAAQKLYGEENPEDVFAKEDAYRIEDDSRGCRYLIIRLPYARKEDIEFVREEDDLILIVQNHTRRFHLPERLRTRYISDWKFEDGELIILFDY